MSDAGANGLQATQVNGGYFPAGAPWYKDVSGTNAKVASDSTAITQWMESKAPPNGFGGAGMAQQHGYFTVDLSIVTIDVPAGTPKRTYQTVAAFHASPDCDTAPIPVPMGGAVEGYTGSLAGLSGYQCSSFDQGGDCHMLFLSRSENRLYETYHATIVGSTFSVGCLALWDTSKVYDDHGRGDQCTSADAAGYPMAPLLFTAEEIAAGSINHAIRFALPNDMLRTRVYVPPATHGTATTGPATSLPYGARMRLKTPYAGMSALSPAAQVVARALQKYGMFHADGGNVPLMGQSDVLGNVKYAAVGFDTHALMALKATDFEVIEYQTPIPVTYNCMRTPITQ
jgi:serine/threonine-protein kinase